jgi:hypothetical protein
MAFWPATVHVLWVPWRLISKTKFLVFLSSCIIFLGSGDGTLSALDEWFSHGFK